jgi:adenylate kinase family enzyme
MDLLNYFGHVAGTPSCERKITQTMAERYIPSTMDEFMENHKPIQEINDWFSDKRIGNFKKTGLLITGPTGCGKTTLVALACKKYGKYPYVLDSSHKRTRKEMNDFYKKIKNFTCNGILVIDDLETLLSKSDSASMVEIAKWAFDEKAIDVIYVSNSVYVNKLNAIVSVCKRIHIDYPSISTLYSKCLNIAKIESIPMCETKMTKLKEFITLYREPRKIINSICMIELVYNYNSTYDIHMDIYDTYRTLLDSDSSLDKKLRYLSVDSGTIPIIFQENYVDFAKSISEEELVNISNSMSLADVYHKKMFASCSSLCVETYGCLSCVFPTLYTHPNIKKNKIYNSPRFGLIWTKQSAMYQKKKYSTRFQEHYSQPITDECVGFMNDIYKQLITDYVSNITGSGSKTLLHSKAKTNLTSFLQFYSINDATSHTELAFDLYNSYNVNTDTKSITKKAFINMIKVCMK